MDHDNLGILLEFLVAAIRAEHRTSAFSLLIELSSVALVASCISCHASMDRRSTPDLVLLGLDVGQWTLCADGFLVTEHKRIVVLAEEAVHILKCSICRFWIQAVHNRNETEVENCPDNVELPVDAVDTDRSNLDDHEVHDPVCCSTQSSTLGTH
jgi:hypothetical protein